MKNALLIFTIFIFMPALAFATERTSIGTVVALEGKAFYENGEKISEDGNVYFGETITTDEDSKMVIFLVDETEITLGENAELMIDQYILMPSQPEKQKAHFNILKGAFLLTSGIIAKTEKPNVTIDTQAGSIGLRGTTVWGGPLDNEYGVLVQLGEVDVYNEHGKVRLFAGEGSFIPNKNKSPRKIGGWDTQLTKRAVRMVTLKDKKGVKEKLEQIKSKAKTRNKAKKNLIKKRKRIRQ